ncbi:TolC Outer membrane protein [Burkholderiaceae bacterium]
MIRHTFLQGWLPLCALTCGLATGSSIVGAQEKMARNIAHNNISLALVLQSAGRNLGVQQAQRSLDASRADVLSANHAPLPNLTLKAASIDLQNGLGAPSGNPVNDWRVDKSIGIDVVWERGNKRALRTQTSEQMVSAAQADVQEAQAQQQIRAAVAFFEWAAAHQRESLMQSMAQSAQQLHQATQQRLKAGDVSEQDADRIAIEWSKAQGDVAQAQSDKIRSALVLQQVTSLPGPVFGWQAQVIWPSATPAGSLDLSTAQLQAWVQARSDVVAAQQRWLAARSALELAQSLKKKDITWGGAYDHYPPNSNSLVELRVQIPLHWGYGFEGEIGRATAQLQQAEVALERARIAAQTDISDAAQVLRHAQERLQWFEAQILPRAQKIASQADYAYQKGALSLTDLIEARRTLRSTQMDALSARTEHAKAHTQWDIRTQSAAAVRPTTTATTP